MFFRYVWDVAAGVLFLRGRLHFHYVDGAEAKANALLSGPRLLEFLLTLYESV